MMEVLPRLTKLAWIGIRVSARVFGIWTNRVWVLNTGVRVKVYKPRVWA